MIGDGSLMALAPSGAAERARPQDMPAAAMRKSRDVMYA